MTTIISGDMEEGAKHWGRVDKMKRDYAKDNAGRRNINTAIPVTKALSDTDYVRISMKNREPFAIIFANERIGISFSDMYGNPFLFFDGQDLLANGRELKPGLSWFFPWVSRDKKTAISAGVYTIGTYINKKVINFQVVNEGSDYIVHSVCPVLPSDVASCKDIFGGDYNTFAYAFIESLTLPGYIALIGMYVRDDIEYSMVYSIPLPLVSSAMGAIGQWHDSSRFLLASKYSHDLSYPSDTDKTSSISTVIGSVSGVKQANLVSISAFTPSVTGSVFSVVDETSAFSFPLYDQIALTEGVGTEISSGVNGTGASDFPGTTNASYILPLCMDEDVISFYVTEVTTATYSDTNVVVGPNTNNFKVFNTTVSQSINVLNVFDGTVIEKIPFGSPIIKYSSISTYPGTSTVIEDINMNFVTPLYMSAMFNVYLYTKSSYISDRVFTDGVVTSGAATRTHNLYIMYNGVEYLVATGIINNPNFVFNGETINVKTTGGNRVELYPDIIVGFSKYHIISYEANIYLNNGSGLYGAELKNQLIISLNRNLQTLYIGNNLQDELISLLGQATFIFKKTLIDPNDTTGRYSYGVGKFKVELTDSSTTYYADSIHGISPTHREWYPIGPTVRNL